MLKTSYHRRKNMSTETTLFIYPFLMLILGIFSALIAKEKDRNIKIWFILGFLFSPISFLAILGLPKVNNTASNEDTPVSENCNSKVNPILIGFENPDNSINCTIYYPTESISLLCQRLLNRVNNKDCAIAFSETGDIDQIITHSNEALHKANITENSLNTLYNIKRDDFTFANTDTKLLWSDGNWTYFNNLTGRYMYLSDLAIQLI